ncbi:MAG: Gfo/Idh/MocA family oxidoreductase [Oscillospiraceae bacterium]|nr:Gfo/Idh/MocA family oxidoreductase [Oscillospiraceae bacterium]MDD7471115.1 Gfo/Idh/MocA family oxidoreductase [Oscillospiraceae bacterium]MDY2677616.1 Gfo/Idh/MocA family oxidoreductase [Oscillospiraceae bacterium]
MASILDAFKESHEEARVYTGRKMRVGIIGCGWIAEAHVKSYQRCDDVEIVAFADLVPGKAEAFAKKCGVENAKFYNSDKELIDNEKDIDAVSICTYNRQHAPCAIYALEHGVNVLLEKPMCVTIEEAADICRAEKKSGKILSIGFQPRFDENMKMVKKVVESGVLGKIYYIQTGGGRRKGIPTPYGTSFIQEDTAGLGALGDIGCYSLDMVLNAIGYPKPLTVTGYKSGFFGKKPEYLEKPEYTEVFGVDDFAAAFVRLENDIILDFRIAWAMHINTPGDTIILGTEGGLRIPSTECWNGSIGGPMTLYHNIAGECVETIIPEAEEDEEGGSNFDKKIRSFIDAIEFNLPAPVPSSQIIYNQAIIDGISRSAELGKEIEIEIPEI